MIKFRKAVEILDRAGCRANFHSSVEQRIQPLEINILEYDEWTALGNYASMFDIMNTEKHKDNPLYGFMHLHVQMHYLSISTAMQHLIVIVKCLIKEIILFHKYHLVILFSFNHIIHTQTRFMQWKL